MDAPTTRSEMLRRLTACAHRAISQRASLHRVERVERVELELEQGGRQRLRGSEEEKQSGSKQDLEKDLEVLSLSWKMRIG
jgi:hypothetical protein